MTADPTYLRPNDAAARFGVHVSTLRRWVQRGYIGAAQIDGVTLYRASDIQELIAAHETPRTVVPAAPERAPLRVVPDDEDTLFARARRARP